MHRLHDTCKLLQVRPFMDGALNSSLNDTFAGVIPQPFDIAHWWLAEELFVLAAVSSRITSIFP